MSVKANHGNVTKPPRTINYSSSSNLRYSTSPTKTRSKTGWSWRSQNNCYRSFSNFKPKINSTLFRSGFKTLSWLTWQKNKARFCFFQKLYSFLPKLYSLLLFATIIHSSWGKFILVRFASINKTFTFMICPRLPSCVKKEKYSKALIASFWHHNTILRMDIALKLMFGPVEWYFTLCLWEIIHSIC